MTLSSEAHKTNCFCPNESQWAPGKPDIDINHVKKKKKTLIKIFVCVCVCSRFGTAC